jgi:hypothetical protein
MMPSIKPHQQMNHSPIYHSHLSINMSMKGCATLELSIHHIQGNLQNRLGNVLSLFEIMDSGNTNCTHVLWKNKLVTSSPITIFLQGINCTILMNLLTTRNSYSCPYMVLSNPILHFKPLQYNIAHMDSL